VSNLLQTALQVPVTAGKKVHTAEEVQLALAVLRGTVTLHQATIALGRATKSSNGYMSTAYWILNVLKYAVAANQLKVEEVK